MSAVWVFQQFATAIGRERELESLREFHYGSATFEHDVTNFWLNGDLQISPLEEVAFLRRMFPYDLPVERAPHRHREGGADDAARKIRERRGRARLLAAVAGRHDRPGQDRQRHRERRARQLAGRRSSRPAAGSSCSPAAPARGGHAGHHRRRRSRAARAQHDRSGGARRRPRARARHGLVELWTQGKPAFGVYAPNENPGPRGQRGQPPQPAVYTREGGEKLAMNPLYDYVFLNLEGGYDAAAVKAMADGLRSPSAASRKALIVRIPPIDKDGAASHEGAREGDSGFRRRRRHDPARARAWMKRSSRSASSRMPRRTCGRRRTPAAASSRC